MLKFRISVLLACALPLTLGSVTQAQSADPVVKAAGDIACPPGASVTSTKCKQAATADLLVGANQVLPLGDNQYTSGTLAEYRAVYDGTWGVYNSIAKPAVGDNEYLTPNAQGYREYFGALADPDSDGNLYYSYDIGEWHVVVLDSNCDKLPTGGHSTGCSNGSPQENWLEQDLDDDDSKCTLAYWHHPFASSRSPVNKVKPLFADLYRDGAELVLSGHVHNYERFAPQTPTRTFSSSGVVQFVVGTGGKSHRAFGDTVAANSLFRDATHFGVLELTLHAGSYDWRFVATNGSVIDSGTALCH